MRGQLSAAPSGRSITTTLMRLPFWASTFAVFLAFRLLNAAVLQTYANPDEWWQAPEIAHSIVFKTGHKTWEWWGDFKLRSSCHPLLLAAFAFVGDRLGILSAPAAVAAVPKVVHAVVAAAQDILLLLLALKLYGSPAFESSVALRRRHCHHVAVCCAFALVFNWFLSWGMGRPFVNALEAALWTGSFYLWVLGLEQAALFGGMIGSHARDQRPSPSSARYSFFFFWSCLVAGFTIGIRPTAAIPWVVLASHALWAFGPSAFFRAVVPFAVSGGLLGLGVTVIVDSIFYGAPTFPLLAFLRLNFLHGVDRFYGAYSPYWYLIDGLPATCAVYLPMIALGIAAAFKTAPSNSSAPLGSVQLLPALAAGWYVFVLSLTAHKEHRFLLPMAGLLALYAGRGIWAFLHVMPPASRLFLRGYDALAALMGGTGSGSGSGSGHKNDDDDVDDDDIARSSADKASSFVLWFKRRALQPCRGDRWFSLFGLCLLAVANIIACAYFNVVHQKGPVAAVHHLAAVADEASSRLAHIDVAAATRALDRGAVARSEYLGSSAARTAALDTLMLATAAGSGYPLSSLMGVHFLMQCHSAPYHAALHNPLVQMAQLDCSPPVGPLANHTVTEAALWREQPMALLQRLYGPSEAVEPPLACAAEPSPSSAVHRGESVRAAIYSSFAALAGIEAAGDARDAIPAHLAAHPDGLVRRSLPTHIVTFDSDVDAAGRQEAAAWLERHGYFLSAEPLSDSSAAAGAGAAAGGLVLPSERAAASFFFGFHGADAHQQAHADPSRVLVFEHRCWRRLFAASA